MKTVEIGAWDDAGVHIIEVIGEFDMSACPRFRAVCDRDDAELVVVDLRKASFLDSSALEELFALQRKADLTGSRLAILRPDGAADRIFKLTGIDGHLPLYDARVPLLAHFNYG